MTVDGLRWYLPVRKVEYHIAKRVSDEAEFIPAESKSGLLWLEPEVSCRRL